MSPMDMFAIVAWPMALSGVLLFIFVCRQKAKFGGLLRWLLIGAAAVLFFLPLSILSFHSSDSHITAAALQFLFILLGGFFCSLLIFGLATSQRRRNLKCLPSGQKMRLLLMSTLLALLGISSFAYGVRNLIGDYLLARQYVEGVIQETRSSFSRRGGIGFHLHINGQHYLTTADVFERARTGDHVRAEVGAGSGMIYRLDSIRTRDSQLN